MHDGGRGRGEAWVDGPDARRVGSDADADADVPTGRQASGRSGLDRRRIVAAAARSRTGRRSRTSTTTRTCSACNRTCPTTSPPRTSRKPSKLSSTGSPCSCPAAGNNLGRPGTRERCGWPTQFRRPCLCAKRPPPAKAARGPGKDFFQRRLDVGAAMRLGVSPWSSWLPPSCSWRAPSWPVCCVVSGRFRRCA